MASAWNRMAASARTVELTPHAPSHGSIRSSYLKPSTSRPLTKVSAQSLRASISVSIWPTRSLESSFSCDSSRTSDKFIPNSVKSISSPGIMVISMLPSAKVTDSGSTISISNSEISISSTPSKSASRPSGAAYNPFSIAIAKSPNNIRLGAVWRTVLLPVHP